MIIEPESIELRKVIAYNDHEIFTVGKVVYKNKTYAFIIYIVKRNRIFEIKRARVFRNFNDCEFVDFTIDEFDNFICLCEYKETNIKKCTMVMYDFNLNLESAHNGFVGKYFLRNNDDRTVSIVCNADDKHNAIDCRFVNGLVICCIKFDKYFIPSGIVSYLYKNYNNRVNCYLSSNNTRVVLENCVRELVNITVFDIDIPNNVVITNCAIDSDVLIIGGNEYDQDGTSIGYLINYNFKIDNDYCVIDYDSKLVLRLSDIEFNS